MGGNIAAVFVNAGAGDFTPVNGSVLDGTGFNGVDIGALCAADGGGGGSGISTLIGEGGLIG